MRHSQEEWKILINKFRDSGLSQRQWCKIYGEDRNRLQYWVLRLQYLDMGTDIAFAEVVTGGDNSDINTSE